jgi:carbonyl reductase 1
LPLIRDGGRVVNVSSAAGKLHKFSPALQDKFKSAKTHNEVTELMEGFKSAVAAGKEKEEGWPSAAYATSKAGITSMTRCIAEDLKTKGSKTLVNACCPGYVRVRSPS